MPLEELLKETVETGRPPGLENIGTMGMPGEGIKVVPRIIGAIIHRLAMMGQLMSSLSGDDDTEKAFGAITRKASGIGKGITIEDVKGFISTLTDMFMKGTPAIGVPPGLSPGVPTGMPPGGAPGVTPPAGATPPAGLTPAAAPPEGMLEELAGAE
jgi:hypothetical protein